MYRMKAMIDSMDKNGQIFEFSKADKKGNSPKMRCRRRFENAGNI